MKLPIHRLGLLILLVAPIVLPKPLLGHPAGEDLRALQEEVEALKEGQALIQKELEEISALLRSLRGPQPVPLGDILLSVDGDPFKGSPTAPITVVEFSDYQCPYCARHVHETMPHLERDYIQTGIVKYVFRDFPITAIHDRALMAAQAASCAGKQGQYWEMHDQLFANRAALSERDLEVYATGVGLDLPSFRVCLESDEPAQEIREDMEDGRRAGVRGTPTFFLGRTDASTRQIKVLDVVRGARPYSNFQETIDRILRALK